MLLVYAPKSLCSVLRAVLQPSCPALTTGVFPAYEGRCGGCRILWAPCLSPFADRDLHSPTGWQKCLGSPRTFCPQTQGFLALGLQQSWLCPEICLLPEVSYSLALTPTLPLLQGEACELCLWLNFARARPASDVKALNCWAFIAVEKQGDVNCRGGPGLGSLNPP